MTAAILLAMIPINLMTFVRFWQDKVRAVRGERRVPEVDLLTLAVIGGTPAAFVARHVLRHKTRKQPFSTHLMLIAAIQAGIVVGLFIL